jgi:hypothetical protein
MGMDNYYNWEKMAVSSIVWLMIKCFNFDTVDVNTAYRKDVESGVWITVKIEKGGKTWYIDGQRTDIIQRRLIEYLDGQNIRNDYLKERSENLEP